MRTAWIAWRTASSLMQVRWNESGRARETALRGQARLVRISVLFQPDLAWMRVTGFQPTTLKAPPLQTKLGRGKVITWAAPASQLTRTLLRRLASPSNSLASRSRLIFCPPLSLPQASLQVVRPPLKGPGYLRNRVPIHSRPSRNVRPFGRPR